MRKEKEVYDCAVSWSWLLQFSTDRQTDLRGKTTQEVVSKIIIPETIKKQIRYVDLISSPHVAKPTYFVSHYWGYRFLDLIESLKSYFSGVSDNDRANIYLWIDIFAVNQHRGSDQQTTDLENLHLAIHESGKGTLVCMDNKGTLLTR